MSVQHLGSLADRAPMPVLGIDRDGRIIHANDSLCALTGFDRDEIVGSRFWELIVGPDAERRRERFLRLRDEGVDTRFDARIDTADGTELLLAWHNVPFLDEDGRLEAVYSIGADITALRRAERRLERFNTMLRASGEISGLALRTDDHGELLERACEVLVGNGACAEAWIALVGDGGEAVGLVGSSSGDGGEPTGVHAAPDTLPACIGRVLDGAPQVLMSVPSEDCDGCPLLPDRPDMKAAATLISHGEHTFGVLVTRLARTRPVEDETLDALRLVADDLGFALATLEARAMHEHTEQSLDERTKMLDAFFTSSLDPAAILDRDFNFLRVNEAYARSCDRRPHELIGLNHFDLFTHDENQRIFERVRDTGEAYEVHARPFEFPDHPEWGVTWWDWALVPTLDDEGETTVLTLWLRDVTQEQRAKQQLQAQRDRLDEMVAERTERLQQTNELLQAIVDSSPTAVVLHDLEGNVTLWNPAAEQITGYAEEEAIGGPSPIVPDEARSRYEAGLDRLRAGQPWADHVVRRHRNGDPLHLEITAAPLRDADGEITGFLGLFTDIGERLEAEQERADLLEQLEAERATLEAIIQNAPEGIVLTDEEARITMVNPAAEELYRRPVPLGEDRESHARMQLHHPDGEPYDVDDLPLSRSALHGEVVRNEELSIVWPDGQRRDLLGSTAPIRTSDGEISGAVAVFQDVTEARENERERERLMALLEEHADRLEERVAARTEELARSRDQVRTQRDFVDAVIQNAGSLVVVVDGEGRILRFNRAAEELSGWSEDEVRGRDFVEALLPPDERERVREDLEHLAGEQVLDYEASWQCRDGSRRRISWRLSTVLPVNGSGRFVIGTGWDVTAERRMERELQASEEKYRELVESARSVIIRWGLDGTIQFVNEYGLELFGYSEEEMVGEHVELIVPEVDSRGTDLSDLVARILASPEDYWINENENVASDGTRYWMSWSNRVIRNADGEVTSIMAVGVDRTAEKQAEEQLRASREDLRDLTAELARAEQRERREIATVLHDNVGQLLAFARMKLGSVMDGADAEDDLQEIARYVDEAIAETRSLTTQLAPPVLEQLGFVAAVKWLADELGERHGLSIPVNTPPETLPLSDDVAVTVFQATRELLINAIKHADPVQVKVALRLKDDCVCVEVADDGVGFDPAALNGRTASDGGFGLLNVRERIGYLGGVVEIDSAPGEGTAVTLICPTDARETRNS